MSRTEKINTLIEYDLNNNLIYQDVLRDLMREGFKGYDNMTDDEINTLYEQLS